MLSFIKHNYIPILSLFVIFFDEIFNTVILLLGITTVEGIKQYQAILFFLIVVPIMTLDLLDVKLNRWTRQVVILCVVILGSYVLTSLFYGSPPPFYFTYLYCYGAECLPAAYIGAKLANSPYAARINGWLPFFLIPSTLILGTVGVSAAMMGEMVERGAEGSGALTYHSLSYMMAFCFSYSCYYVFFSGVKKTKMTLFLKIALFLLMIYSTLVCMLSGGRGAFFVIIVESLFMLYFYISNSKSKVVFFRSAIVLFIVAVAIAFVISNYGLLESSGISRLESRLTQDEARASLYNKAYDIFLASPIWGNGLGSIWWTMGIYSHNVILDLLAEVGLIGAFAFVFVLLRTFFCSLKLSRTYPVCLLALIVLIGCLVNDTFSGYWIGSIKLFFVCSFIHCKYSSRKNRVSFPKIRNV